MLPSAPLIGHGTPNLQQVGPANVAEKRFQHRKASSLGCYADPNRFHVPRSSGWLELLTQPHYSEPGNLLAVFRLAIAH